MNTDQLKYPVVMVGKNLGDSFMIRKSEVALRTTTPLTLKQKGYPVSFIVDSAGCRYDILSVEREDRPLFPAFLDSLINEVVRMKLSLSDECRPISASELGLHIRSAFDVAGFAEVAEDVGLTIPKLESFLSRATTVSEIIAFLDRDEWEDIYRPSGQVLAQPGRAL